MLKKLSIFLSIVYCWSVNGDSIDSPAIDPPPLNDSCALIDALFAEKQTNNVCRCYSGVPDFDNLNLDFSENRKSSSNSTFHIRSDIWISCTQAKMPQIGKALKDLPENTYLSKLNLWDNFMPVLRPIFGKIKTEKLIFDHNRLYDLSAASNERIFESTAPYLRHLILRNNEIRALNRSFLANLTNLRTLDLSFNFLSNIDERSFGSELAELRFLSLEHNEIESMDKSPFYGLSNLEILNLAENRLNSFESSEIFRGLENLKILNLEKNRLTSLSTDIFKFTPNLHTLKLGGNLLNSLDFKPSLLPNLKSLYINNNALVKIPNIDSTNLELLNLDENLITDLANDQPLTTPSLKILSLTSNRIREAKNAKFFEKLSSLTILSLQNNSIEFLDENLFVSTRNLQKLLLSQNLLRSLSEKSFASLENLQVLNLARNRLSDWSKMQTPPNLKKLFLNKNEFKVVNRQTLSVLEKVPSINLADNPFACACSNLQFSAWINKHNNRLINVNNTYCFFDAENDDSDYERLLLADLSSNSNFTLGCSTSVVVKPILQNRYANSSWVTALAFVLGVSSVLTLAAVAYLCLQDAAKREKSLLYSSSGSLHITREGGGPAPGAENGAGGGYKSHIDHFIRRLPSDMVNLIPKNSSLTVPLIKEGQ